MLSRVNRPQSRSGEFAKKGKGLFQIFSRVVMCSQIRTKKNRLIDIRYVEAEAEAGSGSGTVSAEAASQIRPLLLPLKSESPNRGEFHTREKFLI